MISFLAEQGLRKKFHDYNHIMSGAPNEGVHGQPGLQGLPGFLGADLTQQMMNFDYLRRWWLYHVATPLEARRLKVSDAIMNQMFDNINDFHVLAIFGKVSNTPCS
jgi:hypothetical protein